MKATVLDSHKSRLDQESATSLNTSAGMATAFLASTVAVNFFQKADGAVLTATDAEHRALANQYASSVVWITTNFTRTDGTKGSATASGGLLNPYTVITAAHNTISASSSIRSVDSFLIGQGNFSNAPTNTRLILNENDNLSIFPGHNPANSGAVPDISIIHLSDPVLGAPTLTIGSAGPGDLIYSIGYGRWGSDPNALNPQDGNARGWENTVQAGPTVVLPDEYYDRYSLVDRFTLTRAGLAGPGDSGHLVLNTAGEFVGVGNAVASSSGFYSVAAVPVVNDWITAQTIPESGVFGIIGVAAAIYANIRKR